MLRWRALVLREVEQRLDVAGRLAACIRDPRDPERVVHGFDEITRFRLPMIAAGYEDGNDADRLRTDPMFKLAMARLGDEAALCSQPTISRLENLPDTRALLRMGRAMVDLCCASFRQAPRRIVLDVDDTFDAVHGGQQLRLFNAHHDEYGFLAGTALRFAAAPSWCSTATAASSLLCCVQPSGRAGARSVPFCAACYARSAPTGPGSRSCCGADSHYCAPEVLRWCRANKVGYLLGVAPTS